MISQPTAERLRLSLSVFADNDAKSAEGDNSRMLLKFVNVALSDVTLAEALAKVYKQVHFAVALMFMVGDILVA